MLRQRLRKVKATKGGIGVQNNFNYPPHTTEGATKENKLLKSIWGPKKKPLIESLHERRIGENLLVEELHDLLEKDKNRTVVIIESVNADKLSGMGGIGKTLTATWYAHKYEHNYDHVVWIDCGEGSLLTSFQKLARDLDIKHLDKLSELEEFSTKSYEELADWRCLWIFDYAENYKGSGGIVKVLPKYMDNFFCLITSRSRDWGVKNIGYGKITALQLDIFSEQEGLDFFKRYFEKEIQYTEFQLKELCRLLGNLPLAMQLAVAALNQGKINLENYIEKTSAEDIENIVDTEFDAYEKTISASVKITIDVLEKEENGIVAKNILNIFGYIQPDDVIIDLFQEVLQLSFEDVNKGIELLEKYSLISKEKKIGENSKPFVSIHRLLQQVVRHNSRDNEKETLRNILGCEGFVDHKLLPFTKFASEELRKEFPEVKAELLDQQQLIRLVKEKKFEKSVQLSKFIYQELQRDAAKFNYAICLEMNGQLEDNIIVLEKLYKKEMKEEMEYEMEMGLLRLDKGLSKSLVGGHLLVSHWKMDNKERLQQILEERKSFTVIHSEERMNTMLRILISNLIQCNYSLTKDYVGGLTFKILDENKKRIKLRDCSVDLSIPLPIDMQELILKSIKFKNGNTNCANLIDVSDGLPKKLNTLKISCWEPKEIILSLSSIYSIKNITLHKCALSLDSGHRISPRQLTLIDISFVKNGQELSSVTVNEIIDFHNMKRFKLVCPFKNKLSIDLSEESAKMEYLHLRNVSVVSLKSANGRVNIKEAEIENCFLDLSILPPSLEKLSLSEGTKVCVSGEIALPNLKYLDLSVDFCPMSHFHSLNLTYLYLRWVEEVDVDILPPSTEIVRIDRINTMVRIRRRITRSTSTTKVVGGVINLDTLILYEFPLTEVEITLTHFRLKLLVIYSLYNPLDLIPLVNIQIPTIAIGKVDWGIEDFQNSSISKQVDRESEYYVFHQGKGKAIEEKDFLELYLRNDIF